MDIANKFNSLACGLLLAVSAITGAQANPSGATVVHGTVSFSQPNQHTLNVTNSPNAIINWQQFGIKQGEITRFIQQNANSAVLNRIIGQDPSAIMGQLSSNGKVFLINPNGIIFGQNSVVNTSGLIASTLGLSNQDFLNGRMHFADLENAAEILNQGFISASNSGEVVFVAPRITNEGTINVDNGSIVLAAGQSVTINSLNYDNIEFEVQAPDNKVVNLGEMISDGGSIGVFAGSIVNKGRVSANAVTVDDAGNIVFVAKADTIIEDGSVTATSETGKGGNIEITGERVGLFGNTSVDASGATGGGEVLVGGDYQGQGDAKTAKQTVVSRDTVIKADATQSGDGGKVIVWSDDTTNFKGTISATGGDANTDHGGFVEVSGKKALGFDGYIDVTAGSGNTGTILFDPLNIIIQSSAGTNNGALADNLIGFLEGGATDFFIDQAALIALSGNIELQAEVNITINADVNLDLSNQTAGTTVTLRAGDGIFINGNITLGLAGNGGNLVLSAGDSGAAAPSATAAINIAGNITTNDGDLSMTTNSGSGGITSSGNLDAGSGTIVFDSVVDSQLAGGILTAATLTSTGTGALTATANTTYNGGILDSDLFISNSVQFFVTGDLTLGGTNNPNPTISLNSTGNASYLQFTNFGSQSLLGNGNIVFAGTIDSGNFLWKDSGLDLTIGSGINISGGGNIGSSVPIINFGNITADQSGRSLTTFSLTNNGTMGAINGASLILTGTGDNTASGIINVDASTLTINVNTFNNDGQINAINASTLNLNSSTLWTNTGTISATTGSTLNLGGQFGTSDFYSVIRDGSTITNLTGVLDNTGNTLVLDNSTGHLHFMNGTIRGGTLTATGTSRYLLDNGSGTLDSVTLDTDITIPNGRTLFIQGDLQLGNVNTPTITLAGTGNTTYLQFVDITDQAITGNGNIVFAGTTDNGQFLWQSGGATLFFDTGITIRGGGNIGVFNSPIVNFGTIIADTGGRTLTITDIDNRGSIMAQTGGAVVIGGSTTINNTAGIIDINAASLTVNATSFVNDGAITISNGSDVQLGTSTGQTWINNASFTIGTSSSLELDGSFTTTDFNNISMDGSVFLRLSGLLDNTANTLTLDNTTGDLHFLNGTIMGGIVDATGGSRYLLDLGANGNLDNVTLNADISVPNARILNIQNDLTLNGTITLNSTGSFTYLQFNSSNSQSLLGTGNVVLAGTAANNWLYKSTGIDLTIGANINVSGSGNVGWVSAPTINLGTITADQNGRRLDIYNFTNNGLISTVNGADLFLTSGWTNTASGTITANNASITTATGAAEVWSNAGTFTLANNASATLYGTFTTADMIGITNDGTTTTTLTGLLDNSASTLALDAVTGDLHLGSGTITGGTITTTGGAQFIFDAGTVTFDNVAVDTDLSLGSGSSISVLNDLTLGGVNNPNPTITLTDVGTSNINFSGGTAHNLNGNGSIFLGNTASNSVRPNSSGDSLTIGAGITLHGAGQVGNNSAATTTTSNGTIIADVAGQTLTAYYVTNNNIMTADGGTLTMAGDWSNTGTLSVLNAGLLNLGGNFVTAGVGALVNDGTGKTRITGNLDNTASTFTLDDTTGDVYIHGGTIRNGTLTVDPISTSQYLIDTSNATFDNVTLDTDLTIDNGRRLDVLNGLTLGGTNNPTPTITLASTGSFTDLRFLTLDQTLAGSGTVLFAGSADFNRLYHGTSGRTVTLGSSITVRGGGEVGISFASVVNQGTIIADQAGRSIDIRNVTNNNIITADAGTVFLTNNWSNTGTLNVINGGLLDLGGNFTTAGIGALINDGTGTTNLTGVLDNTASVFTLDDTTGSIHFTNGTIQGGTITVAPASTSAYLFDAGNGTFDNVILDTDIVVENGRRLDIVNGLFLGGTNNPTPTITLASTGSFTDLRFLTLDQTLAGSGTILFAGSSDANRLYHGTGGLTLTIGSNITVRGGGEVGLSSSFVDNQGTIIADQAGRSIDIRNVTNNNVITVDGGTVFLTNNWSNSGTLNVINAGLLDLGGTFTTAGIGALINDGTGTTNLTGTLDNTASVFTLDDTTGSIHFVGGSIQNGTITIAPASSSAYLFDTGFGILDGVVLDADLTVENGQRLEIFNGITLGGTNNPTPTITLNAAGSFTDIRFLGSDQTMAGTGTIVFGGTTDNNRLFTNTSSTTVTIAPGIAISGGGTVGTTSAGRLLINQGTIAADQSGRTITLSNVTNDGLIVTSTGAILSINTDLTSNGTLTFASGTALNGAGRTLINNGLIEGGGVLTLAQLTNAGTLSPGIGINGIDVITVNGNLEQTAAGSMDFELNGFTPGVEHDQIVVNGNVTLDGTINVTETGGFSAVLLDTFNVLDATGNVITGSFTTENLPTRFTVNVGGDFIDTLFNYSIFWTGAVDSNWFTLGNWSTGVLPTAADDVGALAGGPISFNGTSTVNSLFSTQDFTLSGGTLTLNAASGFNNLTISGAATTLNGNGNVDVNGAFVVNGGNFGGLGILTTHGLTTFNALNPFTINRDWVNSNGATIDWISGSLNINAANSFENQGTVNITSATVTGTGSFRQTAGSFNLNGGNITVPTLIIDGGELIGTGTVAGDVVQNAGFVRPGDIGVPGALNISGNFTQTAGSVEIDISSPGTAGVQYDLLAITGTAAFADTLNFIAINGYLPGGGDQFSAITYGSNTTPFTTVLFPPGGISGGEFYNAGDLLVSFNTTGLIWSGSGDGVSWSDPANWTTAVVPNAGEDVFIDVGFIINVDGIFSIGNLESNSQLIIGSGDILNVAGNATLRDNLTVSGTGVIDVAGTLTMDNSTLLLAGGTVRNAVVTTINNGLVDMTSSSTLDNVTLDTDLLIDNGFILTILNDLTLGGANNPTPTLSINSTGSNTRLRFNTVNSTLGGTGTIQFVNNGSNNNHIDQNVSSSTLTIGAGITVRGRGNVGQSTTGRLIDNQGSIIADDTSMTIWHLINNGVLRADGSTLTLDGSWSNSTTIEVINAALLNLDGNFATASFGTLLNDGTGTTQLTGILDNSLSTFTLTDSTGSIHFNGGTIQGGTITVAPASTSAYLFDVGNVTLDGVTLDVDLVIENARTLTVLNDLTLGGVNNPSPTITLASTGSNTRLRFSTVDSTLGGSGTILFQNNNSNNNYLDQNVNSSTLTIGAGITIQGRGNVGQATATRLIDNQGSIIADDNLMTVVNFINNGTLRADGGTLTLDGSWSNNTGIDVINGSVLNLDGNFTTAGLGSLTNDGSGTTNLIGVLDNSLTTLTLDDTTGSLHFIGGTIQGGTITVAPASTSAYLFDVGNGTFDGVILDTDITIENSRLLTVLNDLTLGGVNNPNPTVTLASTGSSTRIRFNTVDSTLGGSGTILFQNNNSNNNFIDQNVNNSTLTIGAGITVRGRGNLGQSSATRLINNLGTVIGDDVLLTVWNVTNNGILRADGGTLTVDGAWTNASTFNVVNAGVFNLDGTFTTADVGTLINDGTGTTNLTGTLDNTAATLTLDNSTGSLHFNGGTVLGGTLSAAPASTSSYLVDNGNATLDGVQLDADLLLGNARTLTVLNDLTLGGVNNPAPTLTLASTGSTTRLRFNTADSTLGGNGTVLLQDNGPNNNVIDQNPATSTLTIGANITVRGRGTIGQNSSGRAINNLGTIIADAALLTVTGVNWTNNGTLRADGGTLTTAGTWSNTGTIEAINNGIINLGGTFTTAGVGALINDGSGTMNLSGILDLLASTLTLDDTTGSLRMVNGTIKDGTISVTPASSSTILFDTNSGTFDNILLDADLTIQNNRTLIVLNGLTLGGVNHPSPTITLASTGNSTTLRFDTVDSTLGGTGTILLQDNGSNNNYISQNVSNSTLTLGANITVRGRGFIGENGSARAINNLGSIIAEADTLTVRGVNWTNNGILRADGGSLTLDGSWSNTATLNVINGGILNLGGTFSTAGVSALVNDGTGTTNLTGTLDNTASTFTLDDTTGSLHMVGGTIQGGTISVVPASTSAYLFDVGDATFDGVTLDADILLTNGRTLTVLNGLTLGGVNNPSPTITLASTGSSTTLRFSTVDSLLGGIGTILMQDNGSANNFVNQTVTTSTLTIGAGVTIRGRGTLGDSSSSRAINNLGTVIADNNVLNINGVNWTNNGILRADGGTLQLNGSWSNTGTLNAINGSRLNLGGTFTTAGAGALVNDGSGLFVINGTLDNTASTFLIDDTTGDVHFENGLVTGGTLSVASASTSRYMLDTGNATFDGVTLDGDVFISDSGLGSTRTLTINNGLVLGGVNNPNPTITVSSTGPITNQILFSSADQTVSGTGTILFNNFSANSFINQSSSLSTLTLGANVTVRGIGTIGGTGAYNNLGTIEITTPGTLTLNNVSNNGVINLSNGGVISLLNTAANDGIINIGSGSTLTTNNTAYTNNGQILGNGVIDLGTMTLTNAGVIEPGGNLAVGQLIINGDYVQTASGSLVIDAAGTDPGVTHDLLVVNGTAALDGNLTVGIIGGYTSSVQDVIRFITTDGSALTGTFGGTVNLPANFGAPTYGLSFVEILRGASIFWIGGVDNNWFTGGNWNTGSAPTLSDDVEIIGAGFVNFNGTSSINSLFADQLFNITGGSLTVAESAVFQDLSLTGGTYTSNGQTTVNGNFTFNNATINGTGSLLTSFLSVTNIATNAVVSLAWNSLGAVDWTAGNLTFNNAFTNNGNFNITSNGTISGTGTFDNQRFLDVNNTGGTANIAVTYTSSNSDTFIASGASFGLGGATLTLTSNDELAGHGEFVGDVINNGYVAPGGVGATGILSISGNYTQGATGVLEIELNGVVAGTQHDQLLLNGAVTATLGGTVDITLLPAYVPLASDNYQFISAPAGSIIGTFVTENIPVEFSPNVVNYAAGFVDISIPGLGLTFTNSQGDFDLSNPLNWSSGVVPIAGTDDITLNFFGQTLLFGSGALSINSLDLAFGTALDISGGTFNIVSDSTLQGDLTISGGSLVGAANITLNGNFIWTGGDVSIGGLFQTNGNSTLNNVLGTLFMNTDWTNFGNVNWVNGDIQLANATLTNNNVFTANATGTIIASGVSGITNNSLFSIDTDTTIDPALFIFTQNGTISLNGGDLTIQSLNNNGLIDGNGTIFGDVTNNGTIAPGFGFESIGTITIDGNYTQTNFGSLNIELNGTTAGVGHDQLIVGGIGVTADIDGTLNVTLFGGYTPATNDNFQFLTVGGSGPTFTGTFATENLPVSFGANTVNYAALSADITFPLQVTMFTNSQGDFDLGNILNWTSGLPTLADDILLDFNGQVLFLSAGSLDMNTLSLTLGTELDLQGGTFTLANNSTLNGTFTLSGGTFTTAANTSINGTFNWLAGDLNGGGSLIINNPALLNIAGNVARSMTNFILTNNSNNLGNIWSTTGGVNVNMNNASITNNGRLVVTSDGALASTGGVNSFTNTGTLDISTATTTNIFVPFSNSGNVDIQSGLFNLTSSYTQTAGSTALSGGTLTVPLINLNGGILSGNGTVNADIVNNGGSVRPGTALVANILTINGNYSDVVSGGSEVVIKIESAFNDQLNITGSADFANTILRLVDNGAVIANGSTFNSVVTTGTLLNPFASITNPFVLFNVAQITNVNNIDLIFNSGFITWTGLGDGVSWNDAANWDFGTPTITDIASIGNFNITVTGGGAVDILTLGAGGSITLLSGTFTIGSNSSIDGALILNGGDLSTSAAITQLGNFIWTAGNLSGGGSLTVGDPSQFLIDGNTSRSITSFALINNSTNVANAWSMTGAANISFTNASITNNGVLDITSDGSLLSAAGVNAFINNGTLTANSPATASILLPFTNSATLQVQSGTLLANAGYTQTGTGTTTVDSVFNLGGSSSIGGLLTINTGASMDIAGATTINNLDTFGTALISGNGNVSVNGNFNVAGLTLQGSGLFTITGATNVSAALVIDGRDTDINNGAIVTTTAPITVDNGALLRINNGGVVNTGAQLTVNNGSALSISNGGQLNTAALLVIDQATSSMTIDGGGVFNASALVNIDNGATLIVNGLLDLKNDTASLVNAVGNGNVTIGSTGRIVKTAGAATSNIDIANFVQNGALEVQNGTLQVVNLFSNDGLIRIAAGATFDVNPNTITSTGTVENAGTFNGSIDNTGLIEASGVFNGNINNISGTVSPGIGGLTGTMTINGTYTQGVSAELRIDIAGTSGSGLFDLLTVSGSANLAGSLRVTEINGYNAAASDTYTFMNTGSIVGDFDGKFVYPVGYSKPVINATSYEVADLANNTVFFDNFSGDLVWNNPNNWSTGLIPGNGLDIDTVAFVPGGTTITILGGTHQINNLTTASNFTNTNASLIITGDVNGPSGFNYTQDGGAAFTRIDGNFNPSALPATINVTNGAMDINGSAVGDIVNQGVLTINGNVTGDVNNNGTLGGSGTVLGNVSNGGNFNPGNSPGTFTINGDLLLLETSVLNIEIAGLVKGQSYDELVVNGNVLFAGRMNVIVNNSQGYFGALEDSFDPISFSSGTGSLALVATAGYAYDLTIGSNGLNLLTTQVPGLFVPDTQSDVVTLTSITQNAANFEDINDVESTLEESNDDDDDDDEGTALNCS